MVMRLILSLLMSVLLIGGMSSLRAEAASVDGAAHPVASAYQADPGCDEECCDDCSAMEDCWVFCAAALLPGCHAHGASMGRAPFDTGLAVRFASLPISPMAPPPRS
jgi:hypothetical protein